MTVDFVEYSTKVLAGTRTEVARVAQQLPHPLAGQVMLMVQHYLDHQVDRDPPRNIVTAIAYDSGLRDMGVVVEAGLATVLGGMHSLILDDFVDNQGQSGRPWHDLYTCHVLYVLHQQSLQRIHPGDWFSDGSSVSVCAQLDTYRALLDEELNHVGISGEYDTPRLVWEKCSPVKAVIERVLAAANRRERTSEYFRACDLTCFSLCTLDDLLDWREDWQLHRFTYPIQSALTNLGLRWDVARDDELQDRVFFELCYGRTYHALLRRVVDSLDEAVALLAHFSPELRKLIATSRTCAIESWQSHIAYLLGVEEHLAAATPR